MFGSIFYNLWGALIAFSVYFFSIFQKPYTPLRIIISSLVATIIVFIAMYIVRFIIAYILYTPEDNEEAFVGEQDEEKERLEEHSQETPIAQSTVEFQDENAEEIAQVVRTMMDREEKQQANA